MSENVADLGKVVEQYSDGAIRKFSLENGYKFEVYVPDNYTADTPIMIYEHGMGGYSNDWNVYKKRFEEGNCNAIIVRANRDSYNNAVALYNRVVDVCNLEPNPLLNVSFSAGTFSGVQEMAKMIEKYPEADSSIIVSLEGYVATDWFKSRGIIDTLVENDTIFLGFSRTKSVDKKLIRYYKDLAEAGVNVVIFMDNSEYGQSHSGINKSFLKNGILEYITGTGDLPNSYEIMAYLPKADGTGKEWVTIDSSQISSIDDVYGLFGLETSFISKFKFITSKLKDYIINSDDRVADGYISDIIDKIKSTNFLDADFSNNFTSTTSVPSQIPSLVKKHFLDASKTLENIMSLADSISNIHTSYEETDNKLAAFIDKL